MKNNEKAVARTIGKAIARRRTMAGLTQEEVAERLGLGQEAVSRMERGVASLTVARLATLAEIYRCNVAQLVTESSEREDDQARALSAVLSRLPHADRELLIEWMNVFAARFQPRLQPQLQPPLQRPARAKDGANAVDGHADGHADGADGHDGHDGARRKESRHDGIDVSAKRGKARQPQPRVRKPRAPAR